VNLLVFDMDGVLVDVSESYRETIQQTVEHFTGKRITREAIQTWKNRGGWNDDWALSTAMIRAEGLEADYDAVVRHFQSIFHGNGSDGLIMRERWIARPGLLERLSARFQLAVFTGRLRWEAELTLRRFASDLRFDPIVGSGDVPNHKPAPDGLLHIRKLMSKQMPDISKQMPGGAGFSLRGTSVPPLWYVGDTIDDARSAKAAGVPFIGIASPTSERRDELVSLLQAEGAKAVLEDINQLEAVLPQ
jgi:HAD superfamily phosphatase